MRMVVDSFWRAVAYCLHPRVVALSFLPLVFMVLLAFGWGYWFWEPAVDGVALWLSDNELISVALGWLEQWGGGALRAVLAPLLVLFLATPIIVLVSLLLVGLMMAPTMVELVTQRRFPALERRKGASLWGSLWWSLLSTVMAVLALVASLPLWLVPPLVMVLPPIIWGWLTYRIFTFDALAEHATAEERRRLMVRHRNPLLLLGVVSGYLGALPSFMWVSGAMFIAMAPVLIPLAIWLYTLIFAFSSLWFTHYALAALAHLRTEDARPRPGFSAARAAVLAPASDSEAAGVVDVPDPTASALPAPKLPTDTHASHPH